MVYLETKTIKREQNYVKQAAANYVLKGVGRRPTPFDSLPVTSKNKINKNDNIFTTIITNSKHRPKY